MLRKNLLLAFYLATHFKVKMINLNYTFKHNTIYKILLESDILIIEQLSRAEVDRAFGTIYIKNIFIEDANSCIIYNIQRDHNFINPKLTKINL